MPSGGITGTKLKANKQKSTGGHLPPKPLVNREYLIDEGSEMGGDSLIEVPKVMMDDLQNNTNGSVIVPVFPPLKVE
jgi:hypothetical protein